MADADPASELVVRAEWEADRRRALLTQQCARADFEADREDQTRRAAAADDADMAAFAAFRRQVSGEPMVSVAAILERSKLAEDGPQYDRTAPWGSEANPAMLLDGQLIVPGPPRVQRSETDAQLDRARELSGELARYRRRRSSGKREVVRGGLGPADEVDCYGCQQVGASPEQSLLLHQDPDAHPGLAREMDPPREERRSSGRNYRTPMIYR